MLRKKIQLRDVIVLDLSTVEASLSGPKRPQDLIFLSDMKSSFENSVTAPAGNQGHGLDKSEFDKQKLKLTLRRDQRLQ